MTSTWGTLREGEELREEERGEVGVLRELEEGVRELEGELEVLRELEGAEESSATIERVRPREPL
jgi:hypothetical protein